MIELFKCFQDGMVLQRDRQIAIWGRAEKDARVMLRFIDANHEATANSEGEWKIVLPAIAHGGPYEMSVTDGIQEVLIHDILVGDVFLAGGQSNMELPLSRMLDRLKNDIDTIHNPFIREFRVPISYAFDRPKNRLDGGSWKPATGDNRMSFGGGAYFFAAALHERYGIPIGIVNTAAGGSPVEAWLPESYLQSIGGYEEILDQCRDNEHNKGIITADLERSNAWYTQLNSKDKGLVPEVWLSETFNDSDWSRITLPFYFRDEPSLHTLHGCVWFRKKVDIPEGVDLDETTLFLGAIIDADEAFVNGIAIGRTEYKYPPRRYSVPTGILRHGTNVIVIRVIVNRDSGGFVEGKKYSLAGKGWDIDISGEWAYSIGAVLPELPQNTFFQYKPCGLFNAMFSPVSRLSFRGIIWYQGESNDRNPAGYESRFTALIKEWRKAIGQEIPFMFVQLPNFEDPSGNIPPLAWAALREAQRKNLAQPNTAMAVTIDAGEPNDLHPQDKKTVGRRLALCARALVYGENIEYSGPCCDSAVFNAKESTITLAFSHMVGGAVLRNSPSRYFEVCGKEGNYQAAQATIQEGGISIDCGAEKNPTGIRYAWLNNPENPDLFNRSGLPASPFEFILAQ